MIERIRHGARRIREVVGYGIRWLAWKLGIIRFLTWLLKKLAAFIQRHSR